jgi:Mn2+/Fe2+ NRAMP family transporter
VSWGEALRGALVPQLALDHNEFVTILAVLGTTISAYLFFWRAAEEAEG